MTSTRRARGSGRPGGTRGPTAAIRAMKAADAVWAVALTAREGWGFVRPDILRILWHTPGGSFVATSGRRRVGMLTTMCHGRTCWIGNVVVERGNRGKGIGAALVRAALAFARRQGMRRAALLSRERTVGFYAGMGFRPEGRFVGLGGIPLRPKEDARVSPMTRQLFSQVLALDRRACGEDRRRLLGRLASDFGRYFLVYRENARVLGFIVGKPGRGMVDVGPWVAVSGRPDVASALFRALALRAGKRLEIYIPARQRPAMTMLGRMGLKRIAGFVEMRRGGRRRRDSPKVAMLAVAGLEKG